MNRAIGQVTIIAQAIAYHSMFLLSLNRLVAAFFPIRYQAIFSLSTSRVLIGVTLSWCLIYGCIYFWSERGTSFVNYTYYKDENSSTKQLTSFLIMLADFGCDSLLLRLSRGAARQSVRTTAPQLNASVGEPRLV